MNCRMKSHHSTVGDSVECLVAQWKLKMMRDLCQTAAADWQIFKLAETFPNNRKIDFSEATCVMAAVRAATWRHKSSQIPRQHLLIIGRLTHSYEKGSNAVFMCSSDWSYCTVSEVVFRLRCAYACEVGMWEQQVWCFPLSCSEHLKSTLTAVTHIWVAIKNKGN